MEAANKNFEKHFRFFFFLLGKLIRVSEEGHHVVFLSAATGGVRCYCCCCCSPTINQHCFWLLLFLLLLSLLPLIQLALSLESEEGGELFNTIYWGFPHVHRPHFVAYDQALFLRYDVPYPSAYVNVDVDVRAAEVVDVPFKLVQLERSHPSQQK